MWAAERLRVPRCTDSVRLLLAAIAISLVAACASVPDRAREAEPPPLTGRTGCAAQLIDSLAAAVNGGDRGTLERLFRNSEGEHPFRWVSMPLTAGYWTTYEMPEAVDTLVGRHAAGERWRVVSVHSGPGPTWHGGVDFTLRLTRTAPDLAASSLSASGKGAGSCASARIYVLSLGTE